MIRLSTKGRYGTRLMLNLANHYSSGHNAIILRSISNTEDISIRYLEQIIIPLKINKLVKSIRGAGGGYILSRPPARIKIQEILDALEGTCDLVECVENKNFCQRSKICAAHEIWLKASDILKEYFGKITLQDLQRIEKHKAVKP
jgi:Rrf2 family protein